ncbi:MAG TPA: undecaprenyldiphospho-muramoylpentapeptide beta-N-acetylglucosaminyltransferase [Patescibacteria group bacterium]
MRIILAGGGTGGHLFPLIAVADKLKEKLGSEAELLYVGSGAEMEKSVMAEAGIPAKHVMSGKMRRYFSLQNFVDVFKIPIGFVQALWILLWNMPDVVFSKGGYASVPVVLAAWIYRIPILIHESDAIPGRANQFMAKYANRIAIAYPSAQDYFPQDKIALTGNPIRYQVTDGDPIMLRQEIGFSESRKTIMILGGSQGSQIINDAIVKILPDLLVHYQVLHQTGENNFESVVHFAAEQGAKIGHGGYWAAPFLNANKLRDAFAACDLVISRAGASFITEIAANGKPAILVPLEGSANDHQRMNAYALARIGAAIVLEETNLGKHMLMQNIEKILTDEDLQRQMSEKIKTFYHPSAADVIANGVIELGRI